MIRAVGTSALVAMMALLGSATPTHGQALDSPAGIPIESPAVAVNPVVPQQPLPTSVLQALPPITLLAARHELPVPLYQRVLSYIESSQGRLQAGSETRMGHGGQDLPMDQGD